MRFFFVLAMLLGIAGLTTAQDTVRNVKQGNWSDASTWGNATIPSANSVVFLDYDLIVDADAVCIALYPQEHSVTVKAGVSLKITGSVADTMLAKTPEAKASFNNSSFGIYKGVFVGSSGTVKIAVGNTPGVIAAFVTLDNKQDTLITTSSVQDGQDITGAYFSGKFSSLYFNVNANGTNPTASLSIDDHPEISVIVKKETSSQLVRCFEGSIAGNDFGPFTALIQGNIITGLSKSGRFNQSYLVDGTINGNNISGTASSGATFTGKLNNNTCAGQWENKADALKGTWSGKRTL
ncbi:hypothetical protein [Foetidibacter luteolus]|uniref:hypothetical protein n=1 Tax=Foetidibacter luteolus TaxID=2608880 RepID=UPI00129B735B|nr:hypothetical protein [Foetidibacter luteolus]